MRRFVRSFAAAVALVAMLSAPAFAGGTQEFRTLEAETVSPGVDLLLIRPLGLIGLGAAVVAWLPAQAMTMVVRPSEWEKPVDQFLRRPYEFVFVDPLGSH